jgi:hypothetical protein
MQGQKAGEVNRPGLSGAGKEDIFGSIEKRLARSYQERPELNVPFSAVPKN